MDIKSFLNVCKSLYSKVLTEGYSFPLGKYKNMDIKTFCKSLWKPIFQGLYFRVKYFLYSKGILPVKMSNRYYIDIRKIFFRLQRIISYLQRFYKQILYTIFFKNRILSIIFSFLLMKIFVIKFSDVYTHLLFFYITW